MPCMSFEFAGRFARPKFVRFMTKRKIYFKAVISG